MTEDKKIPQTPPPPVLKQQPEKAPIPVVKAIEKPKKKDKMAEFRRGMASLVGCGNVPDFGSKLRAKIEAYRDKIRAKKEAEAGYKQPDVHAVRTRPEVQKQAYRKAQTVRAPVLPEVQKKQLQKRLPAWCTRPYDRAA